MNDFQKYQPKLSLYFRKYKTRKFCKTLINPAQSRQHLSQYSSSAKINDYFKLVQKANKQWKHYSIFTIPQIIRIKSNNNKFKQPILKLFLKQRILSSQPISNSQRKTLWLKFTSIKQNPQQYQLIKNQTSSQQYFDAIIAKDLNRTQGSVDDLKSCENTLQTFAKFNPWIGYCQGFNNTVMFLTQQGFNQQQSFYIWKYVCTQILPTDYYTSMISTLAYVDIIIEIYSILNPQYKYKIQRNKQNLKIVMIPFLVCLFTRQPISKDITRLFWDVIIIQGRTGLIKATLSLFKQVINLLENNDDLETVMKIQKILKELGSQTDIRRLKESIKELYVNQQILDLCMSSISQSKQHEQKETRGQNKFNVKIMVCDITSHVCTQQLHNKTNRLEDRSHQCQVMKQKQPINIIPNFLDQYPTNIKVNKDNNVNVDDLLIGRANHICQAFEQRSKQSLLNEQKLPKSKQSDTQQTAYMDRTQSTAFLSMLMQNPSFNNILQEQKTNFLGRIK